MTRTSAVLVSGHMVDAPDRAEPRFPPRAVEGVTEQVAAVFDGWHVSDDTVIVCGGARGTDIICAEQGLARGARVIVCLAIPAAQFTTTSVILPETDWDTRFTRLLTTSEVRTLADGSADDPSVYARANHWMIEIARDLDPQPHALFVWDGKRGDGPGGTYDQIVALGYPLDDPHLAIINPSTV